MSSALMKVTTKTKRNDNRTIPEGFLIWQMSNKNYIMTIVLLLTILVTVVEMIMDLFASFPFNVDRKKFMPKQTVWRSTLGERREGGEVLVQRACVLEKCFYNCDRECRCYNGVGLLFIIN